MFYYFCTETTKLHTMKRLISYGKWIALALFALYVASLTDKPALYGRTSGKVEAEQSATR